MGNQFKNISGGFNIGSAGRDVSIHASGDIVAGNKTTTKVTSLIGFADEGKKKQFLEELDQIRVTLKNLKSDLEKSQDINEEQKEMIVQEIMTQVLAMRETIQVAQELQVGEETPEEKKATIDQTLDKAGTLMGKISELGKKAADMAEKIAPKILDALPLLSSAKKLIELS